jgi:eukaryotic-like serine/threonine-protein kinase
VTESANSQTVLDWSADGRLLYFESSNDLSLGVESNLMVMPLHGHRKPMRYVPTSSREPRAQFSADGQWVVYTWLKMRVPEVFVESLPAGQGKWQISAGGGDYPRWTGDGKEILYLRPDGTLMSVQVRAGPHALVFGSKSALFTTRVPRTTFRGSFPYDVAPDGRILALARSADVGRSHLTLVLNWAAALEGKP